MQNYKAPALVALFSVLPLIAHAHPGDHGSIGWSSGCAHPFMGLDHILAMIAVGLWAAQLGGRALWQVPCAFVSTMLLGGAMGMAGVALPYVEHGVIASILVLGLLITFAARVPAGVSVLLVSFFAIFHGFAHGVEMPANASGVDYAVGFAISTLVLNGIGMGAGVLIRKAGRIQWLRIAGAAIAIMGTVLVLK